MKDPLAEELEKVFYKPIDANFIEVEDEDNFRWQILAEYVRGRELEARIEGLKSGRYETSLYLQQLCWSDKDRYYLLERCFDRELNDFAVLKSQIGGEK